MDVSIVILNYKSRGLVKQCVKGIVMSQPKLIYEIIVVDNNSNDGCLAMVDNMFSAGSEDAIIQPELPIAKTLVVPPIVTIQTGYNGGFAFGNNIGMRASKGRYVLILNPDVALVPGAIEAMVEHLDTHPDVGMVGPRLTNPDGSVQYSCRRFPDLLTPFYRRTMIGKLPFARHAVARYLMQDFNQGKTQDVDWLFGACLLVRRSTLDRVGLFDERFFMYFEDLDLCRRIWQAGERVLYLSTVTLVHYHHQLSAERTGILGVLKKGGRIHLASGIRYYLKYRGVPLPRIK